MIVGKELRGTEEYEALVLGLRNLLFGTANCSFLAALYVSFIRYFFT